jgi:hypothetical protein
VSDIRFLVLVNYDFVISRVVFLYATGQALIILYPLHLLFKIVQTDDIERQIFNMFFLRHQGTISIAQIHFVSWLELARYGASNLCSIVKNDYSMKTH